MLAMVFFWRFLDTSQGFAKVAARADCSRHRRSRGEEGAGGGHSPPPAPSSPQRLACEPFRM